MMPNMDPKQMAKLMKQMGINTSQIDAKEVIIETDEKRIVIENPQVIEISMQGQKSYQISGKVKEEEKLFSEEDINLVIEQANCTREEAVKALKETKGDIAEAIMKFQK
ncbi:MAG: nascent polypeptide-associated complex protein [Candidatus Anstonellales archaeon]